MKRSYSETLALLFSQLPMYQRQGAAAYKADLSATIQLMDIAGNPENGFKSIHVAGTNGKGSVSHLLASALQEQGYKVGLYTSPHLKDFRERIRVNGEMIPESMVIQFVEHYEKKWQAIAPSFFEITVLMAFEYFNFAEVDIAVVETGMGGRLDSTNVLTPELSIITNIGLDHVQFLGDTIPKIALEKAGIIKNKVPVVIGPTSEEAYEVFRAMAESQQSNIHFVQDNDVPKFPSDLIGPYQDENLRTALLALKVFQSKGWKIEEDAVRRGFLNVRKNTGLRGRWDVLSEKPLCIADCAHNGAGFEIVLNALRKLNYHNLHFVIGMVGDKDVDAVLAMLPKEATYYFCAANIPRALHEEVLAEKAQALGLRGETFTSVKKAFEAAHLYANPEDCIYVGGSVFVVAEVI